MNRLRRYVCKPDGMQAPELHIAYVMIAGRWIEGRGGSAEEALENLVEELATLAESRLP